MNERALTEIQFKTLKIHTMHPSQKRLAVLAKQIVGTAAPPTTQAAADHDETHHQQQPHISSNRGIEMASTSGQHTHTQTHIPSSYARIHGTVSRAPPTWRRIEAVSKEQLQEVLYDKAVGEGIVKVSLCVQAFMQAHHSLPHSLTQPHSHPHTRYRSPSTGRTSGTPSRPGQVRQE